MNFFLPNKTSTSPNGDITCIYTFICKVYTIAKLTQRTSVIMLNKTRAAALVCFVEF